MLIRKVKEMNPKREGNGPQNRKVTPAARPNLRMVRSVSWDHIDPSTIADMVCVVTAAGAAIMFGRTSDNGALSLCILDNESKIKEYPRDETDVHNFALWLKDEYFGGGKKAT